jgi:hypothetical protein
MQAWQPLKFRVFSEKLRVVAPSSSALARNRAVSAALFPLFLGLP